MYALQIAACRLGANCSKGQNLMDGFCLSSGACSFRDYEALIRHSAIPAGDVYRLEEVTKKYMEKLRNSKQ